MQLNGGAGQACGRAALGSAQRFFNLERRKNGPPRNVCAAGQNLGGRRAQRMCRSPCRVREGLKRCGTPRG